MMNNFAYNFILDYAYIKYKDDWCKQRGYDINSIDESTGVNGECYVCKEEFENAEFVDYEYMKSLLDKHSFELLYITIGNLRLGTDEENMRRFTISIDDETEDDGTYDVMVYEKFDGDSELSDLSVYHIQTLDDANKIKDEIIKSHPKYEFEYLGMFKCKG